MVKAFDMDEYEFAIRETKTADVIRDVSTDKSQIGILYLNEFNEKVLTKLFRDAGLEFTELFSCGAYAYVWKNHPLTDREKISIQDLQEYPCLAFEQGNSNSFYFAEEIFSTYDYKRVIKACDRATMLNLMVGLNGYTLCSGIICEELNGSDYRAIPLEQKERMHIGYVMRKNEIMSPICRKYIAEIEKFRKFENNT